MGQTLTHRDSPRTTRRRRAAPACLLLLLVAACGCPPKAPRYDSPAATLATWQSQLCHEDPSAEYACLAADFKRDIGGFQNYHVWRGALLEREPVLAWLVKRADVGDYIIDTWQDTRGQRAVLTLAALGREMQIGFEREVWATVIRADGSADVKRQEELFDRLVLRRAPSQWVTLERPDLTGERLDDIRSIHFDTRWVIAALGGPAFTESMAE